MLRQPSHEGGPNGPPSNPDSLASYGGQGYLRSANSGLPMQQNQANDGDHQKEEKSSIKSALSLGTGLTDPAGLKKATGQVMISPEGQKQYCATPFNNPDVEAAVALRKTNLSPVLFEDEREFQRYQNYTELNWTGIGAFSFYILSFIFYMWIRIFRTLDLGPYTWYGVLVLGVEVLGSTTVLIYGLNLIYNPIVDKPEEDPDSPGKPKVRMPYHARVMIPCYKESLEILRRTVMAAYDATLPEGCHRTIYLCDDGKDPKKRKWVDSLGPEVVYVSGRKRQVGEINGKSGNLNNCFSQIYPKGVRIPSNELVCVFDADQVASKEFFLKTLPLFDGGDDVGMVLSPQCFHNLNLHSDIFNHSNVHFWEYMQPGYDALGFISCTGTNFLVRSNAFNEVGGSPTYTLTEDYALGMELRKYGWHCRYVQEYLAIGEAPDQIRNCYQQRSRWCKGHFQIMFDREHCPFLQKRLTILMKLLYCSGVWSYIVGAISTPTFIIIPLVTIWFGVFPIVVSWWAALGLTVYFIGTNAVLYYCRSVKHVEALWFANVANQILWWTYVKAFWRALNSSCGQKITFKTTLKGATMLMNSAFRDLWMPGLCFILLLISLIIGLAKLFSGPTISSPLAISVLWAIYNAIPPFLVLYYAGVSKGITLQYLCRFCLVLSFFTGATAVGLMWGLYPRQYDYGEVLLQSNFFYNAQRLGALPADNGVAFRGDSLLYERGPDNRDITGGWVTGAAAGNVKMTAPHAFTTSLLAWGLLAFPDGYEDANATKLARDQTRWGADYLLKLIGQGINGTEVIYQVGNYSIDSKYYGRPEDITSPRPFYFTPTTKGGSDLAGSIVAALASTALVWKDLDYGYYQKLLNVAVELYTWGTTYYGKYSAAIKPPNCRNPNSPTQALKRAVPICTPQVLNLNGSAVGLYNSTSYYDDLLWGAAWMYKATGDGDYLADAEDYYIRHLYQEQGAEKLTFDWDEYYWAANILLADITDGGTFHERSQNFLRQWICGFDQIVKYTPKGRAWNRNNGVLGSTANAVFLSTIYGKLTVEKYSSKSTRYTCWARSQVRYMLGDAGRSFVVGFGKQPPTHGQNQAASCPPAPLQCNAVSALLSPEVNPNVLKGALVEGGTFTDDYSDVRSLNNSRIAIEYNAGFQGALAGLNEAPGTWEQCLQGYGVLSADTTVCGKLPS